MQDRTLTRERQYFVIHHCYSISMVLIFSSDFVWSSVCLCLFLEELAVESERMCMSELDRLPVISPVSEAQETNGEATGIYI